LTTRRLENDVPWRQVKLNEIRITQSSPDLIIASFVQEYEADCVNNRCLKSLTRKPYQGRRLIRKKGKAGH
jgi:hypothetical protein